MKLSHLSSLQKVCACAAAILIPASAYATENINVSKIVNGMETPINWNTLGSYPLVTPNSTVTYFTMGHAQFKNPASSQDMVGPGPWGLGWQNTFGVPHLDLIAPTGAYPAPPGGGQFVYSSARQNEATVDAVTYPRTTSAMTFGNGNSDSSLSYTMKIDHAGAAQDYFLLFENPTMTQTVEAAYMYDKANNQNNYVKPDQANARVSVDLYADGLPIWSSESAYSFPSGAATWPWDKMQTHWGKDVTANSGWTKLYLGKLSAGRSLTLTMVVHAGNNVAQKLCAVDYSYSPHAVRCHKVTDSVGLWNIPYTSGTFLLQTQVLPVQYPIIPLPFLTQAP